MKKITMILLSVFCFISCWAINFTAKQEGLHIACDTSEPLTVYGLFFENNPAQNCLIGTGITTPGKFTIPAFAMKFVKMDKGRAWVEAMDEDGNIVKARLIFLYVSVDANYLSDEKGLFVAPLPKGGGPYVIDWGDGTQSAEIVDLSDVERLHLYKPRGQGRYKIYVPINLIQY